MGGANSMAPSPPCYEWLQDCISGLRGGRHFCSTATQWAVGSGTGDTEARGSPATGPTGPRPCTFGCLLPEGASPTVLTPQLRSVPPGRHQAPPAFVAAGQDEAPQQGQPETGCGWKTHGERTGAKAPLERGSAGISRARGVWGSREHSCPGEETPVAVAGAARCPHSVPWPGGFPDAADIFLGWDAATPRAGQATGSLGGDAPGVCPPPAAPFRPRFAPRPVQAAAQELAHAADSCGVAARPARRGRDSAPGGHPASCGVRGGSPGFCAPPDHCSPLSALRHLRFRGVRLLQRRDRGDGEVQRRNQGDERHFCAVRVPLQVRGARPGSPPVNIAWPRRDLDVAGGARGAGWGLNPVPSTQCWL